MPDRRMELLAPAGDRDALVAAVQSGADAVYLGAGRFNARQRAGNFDGDGLAWAVAYCHARGVKVHVTLNTLVRQDELEALFDTIRMINQSGADAVIVQDFGVARAVREMAPDIELHASTQMAAHSAQAARFLKTQGFHRVVLAREATFGDMDECAATGIDVEVFVHGALCVACSGQCLMSSMVGGRSGNRGLCAQPCRLPWRLDAREGYLLSTRDLCAIDDLPRLCQAGVRSLKIEGRLKRPEYVAVTVSAYRRALDALYAGEAIDTAPLKEALRQMFNRGGFTRGYGPGMREQDLMFPARSNHIGVAVGRCTAPKAVQLTADVDAADALVLRRGHGDDVPVKLSGRAGETVPCPLAGRNDALVRLVSQRQMQSAREYLQGERRQTGITGRAEFRVGRPAALTVSDGAHSVPVAGDVVQAATGKPFDPQRARQQLAKTGGTAYRLDSLQIEADQNAFMPASALNALRRDALAALEAQAVALHRETRPVPVPTILEGQCEKPLLYAQSGDGAVLARALACGADAAVYCPNDLRPESLATVSLPERFALAVPAVLTGAALDGLNAWANAHAGRIDMTFLSNVGQLGLAWPGRLAGDFMLNAANDMTVGQMNDWGLETVTPSVELTAGQVARLRGRTNLVLWGRIPLMHLRHCPLRAAKGMKGLHADCKHCDACPPGERLNGRALVDRRGAAFPLRRVAMPGGCVVQVLNSVPLMPLRKLEKLPKASGWRLLLQPDEPVEAVVRVYRAALDGADFKALPEWAALSETETTTGHWFRGVE